MLLPSGDIFIAGGVDATGSPTATTVIVGLTGVTPGPDMAAPRVGHSAVLLTNGSVMIAGGQADMAGSVVHSDTELFDTTTNTFSAGPALAEARSGHVSINYATATGEMVLFAGGKAAAPAGSAQPYLASAELLDVNAGTSSALTQGLTQAQAGAEIARLDTGRYLIVGGENNGAPAAANVFDPQATGAAFSAVQGVVNRSGSAVATRGREVLVAGGTSANGKENSSEVFDSTTQTFSQGVALGVARSNATATFNNNEVILVGGQDSTGASDAVERVDGQNFGQAVVTAATPLSVARFGHSAHLIAPGKVMVVGGYDAGGVPLASIETVDLTVSSGTTGTPTTTTGGTTTGGTTTGGTTTGGTTTGGTTTGGSTGGTGGTGGLAGLLGGLLGGGTGTGSTGGSSGGLSGLLGGLFGGGTSGSSGSGSSSIMNVLLQSAVQALTSSLGSGSFSFSNFMQSFIQNVFANLLGTSGGSGGIGGALSGLLGGLLGGTGGTSGSGTSGGISGLLSGLLGGLLGGGTGGTSGGSSGGLSGLLSGLFGGSGGGTSGGSTSGGTSGGSSSGSSTALTIQAMNPASGAVGDTVTISGINFGSTVGVSFNGTPAQISAATRGSGGVVTIVCTVPNGASTGPVVVSSGGQTANAGVFTVL